MFNKDIYPIPNISAIDTNVLGIKVLPGIDSDPNNLNISHWNVTSKTRHPFLIIEIFRDGLKKNYYKVGISDLNESLYQ